MAPRGPEAADCPDCRTAADCPAVRFDPMELQCLGALDCPDCPGCRTVAVSPAGRFDPMEPQFPGADCPDCRTASAGPDRQAADRGTLSGSAVAALVSAHSVGCCLAVPGRRAGRPFASAAVAAAACPCSCPFPWGLGSARR